jgi:F-type H+-transporting ATPase subunit a
MRRRLEGSAADACRLLVFLAVLVMLGAGAIPARAEEPASHPGEGTTPAVTESAPAHGEHAGQAEAVAEEAEAEEPPELPNAIQLLYKNAGEHGQERPAWITLLYRFKDVAYALLVAVIIIVIVRIGTRKMALIPSGAQNVVEYFIESFSNFILSILGPAGRPYVPFLGSLFLYIWFMNLIGLVPLMKSPTSALSTTAALAICVFLYVQYIGLRRLGPLRYLKHLAGDPQDAIGWGVAPLMFPLHVIGELARPVSLSLRLFGNILGEDVLIGIFAGLGVAVIGFLKLPIGIPMHLPFILLALLMSTVQALVFTLLSTVYIMQVLPHDEDGAGH